MATHCALALLTNAGVASASDAPAADVLPSGALEATDSEPRSAPAADTRQLLEQALARYQEEDYEGALLLLRRLYAMDPNPGVLYNLAATHAALGHCEEATQAYRYYQEQTRSESGRRDAQRQLDALGDCTGGAAPLPSSAPGAEASSSTAAPSLAAPAAVTSAPISTPSAASSPATEPASHDNAALEAAHLRRQLEVEAEPSGTRMAAWITLGAGGALALASAGFAYASARADDEDESQPLAQSGDAVRRDQESGERYNALAWGFAGGAAALAASGLLLLAFEPARSTSVTVAPSAAGPLSLTLQHRF